MSKCSQLRRVLSGLLLATLLWSYAPAAMAAPSAVANTPSADPDEEIVYTDNNGVIRVLDTRVTGSNPEVKWTSPDGNWRAIALGDVNNDGDQEIIAVGGGSNDGRLTIFDPVASNPPNPEQKINGIPWEILYQTSVPGSPQLVATGNFDPNVPGDEIMYLYELRDADKVHEDDFLRLVVLKADSPTPTGRGWQQHFTRDFSEVWERIAVGNLDGQGTDEFGLVAKDSNNMKVFKVDNGASRILEYGSSSRPPQAIAMGAWEGGAVDFLAWGREADPPLGSLYVQRWNSDGSFGDVLAETLLPNPDALFFAQINSNTDAELVVLRDVPSDSNSPRMIVRGRKQSDIPRELEQRLDSDNGYRIGNAGDIDGDGMDEIVLARDNRILVFYEPNVSAKTNNYDLSTNRRNLVVGDLDKNGFISGPQFAVSRSTVETVLEAGGLGKSEYITLTNETTAEAIPFVVTTVGNPSWLTVTPSSIQTPAQIFLTFNSTGLQAGEYRAQLQITSPTVDVVNEPLIVEVKLTVTAALVSLQPPALSFALPCTDTVTARTQVVRVNGTTGVRYTAAIVASPDVAAAEASLAGPLYNGYINDNGDLVLRDEQGNEAAVEVNGNMMAAGATTLTWPSAYDWLSATSGSGAIPDTITVQAGSLYSETVRSVDALLVIVADSRAGAPPGNMRIVPISNLCATDQLFLSMVRR